MTLKSTSRKIQFKFRLVLLFLGLIFPLASALYLNAARAEERSSVGEVIANLHCLLGLGDCEAGTVPPGDLPKECRTDRVGCGLPDLVADMSTLVGEPALAFVKRRFDAADIEFLEGCVETGTRYLVRMPANAANVGDNWTIGTPPQDVPEDPSVPEERGPFVWSPTHEHWHLKNLYTMEILDGNQQVKASQKLSIATGDIQPYCDNIGDPDPTYNFSDFQGISTGWLDAYPMFLPCQWVDVTDLEPGDYELRVTVNPDCGNPEKQVTAECDCTNNSMQIALTIPPKTDFGPDIWGTMFRHVDRFFFTAELQEGPFRK